ncbi:MAG: ATP-binding protein [Candidatus Kaiserbacteria bacterium]|nr:ATP-binding protein [Candidatus Kaiserbacteria bacterium]
METPPWYVLTGGPCSGKTTLVREIETRGHAVLPEAARAFIEEHLATGETIDEMRKDLLWFEKSILRYHVQIETRAPKDTTLFLDRGLPDNLAYFRFTNLPIDDEVEKAMRFFRYRKVFLLEMLSFANDRARFETEEEAFRIHGLIADAYRELGYDIVHVPVLPVPDRADFILERL